MEPPLAQPYQTDNFGIGNFLTEGTSNGEEGGNADSTSNPGQSEATEDISTQDPNGSQEKNQGQTLLVKIIDNNNTEGGFDINGKEVRNNGWDFQCGCSKDRIVQQTKTMLPPSPVDIKEVVEGALVRGGLKATSTDLPTQLDKDPRKIILGQN